MRTIFISYSSMDRGEAHDLSRNLSDAGFETFLAEKDIAGGDNFPETIREALRSCAEVCLLFSPNSRTSDWVTYECGAAWAFGKRLTPLLLETSASDLPGRLANYQALRFHEIPRYVGELKNRLDAEPESDAVEVVREDGKDLVSDADRDPETGEWYVDVVPATVRAGQPVRATLAPSEGAARSLPLNVTVRVLRASGELIDGHTLVVSGTIGVTWTFHPSSPGEYAIEWLNLNSRKPLGRGSLKVIPRPQMTV